MYIRLPIYYCRYFFLQNDMNDNSIVKVNQGEEQATMKKVIKTLKLKLRRFKSLQRLYSRVKVAMIERQNRANLHKHGYKLLEEITNALSRSNLNVFCAFGTLLGFIRDNGFIESDDDIDMGIIKDGTFSWCALENCLSSIGMKKTRQFELDGEITEQTYTKYGVGVDFFLYRENKGCMTANVYWIDEGRAYAREGGHSVMYRDCPSIPGVEVIKKREINIPIPMNYKEYLVANYGENWEIPDPAYKPQNHVRTEDKLEAYRRDFEE